MRGLYGGGLIFFSDEIELIDYTENVNESGDVISVEQSRKIFAEIKSIGQSEFYQAQANGFKPEIKFIVWACDYQGERTLNYKENFYSVIRTYQKDDYLEITCKAGVNEDGRTKPN